MACHPVKNASEENLVPYGAGAILNEVDGNLTLWKSAQTGIIRLHWQGKLRGPDFEPRPFRLEGVCSPDIVDAKGKQFEIPVLRPSDANAAEQREKSNVDTSRKLLAAMLAEPPGTQTDWARTLGKARSTINEHLKNLAKLKYVEERLGEWRVTTKDGGSPQKEGKLQNDDRKSRRRLCEF